MFFPVFFYLNTVQMITQHIISTYSNNISNKCFVKFQSAISIIVIFALVMSKAMSRLFHVTLLRLARQSETIFIL